MLKDTTKQKGKKENEFNYLFFLGKIAWGRKGRIIVFEKSLNQDTEIFHWIHQISIVDRKEIYKLEFNKKTSNIPYRGINFKEKYFTPVDQLLLIRQEVWNASTCTCTLLMRQWFTTKVLVWCKTECYNV